MLKYTIAFLLLATGASAFAQAPERIVQWKKDPMHLFVGPDHGTLTFRPKAELPPEATIVTRQEPLLAFKDSRTNELTYVNKNDVVTSKNDALTNKPEAPRAGRCTRAVGTGFARSC